MLEGIARSLRGVGSRAHSERWRWLRCVWCWSWVRPWARPPGSAGDRIVFSRNGDLITVDPDGTDMRRVTSGAGHATHPSWSPGRTWIAFVRAPRTLARIGSGGSARAVLFRAPPRFDRIDAVAVSPNGSRVAFSTAKVGGASTSFRTCGAVWVVGANGGAAHRVVSGQWAVTGLSWAPDGNRLVASFEPQNGTSPCQSGLRTGIVRFLADGSSLRSLGAPLGTDPDWSPGGGRIVFRDTRRTCHACGEVWAMRPDGSHQHEVASPPGDALGLSAPRWSPSGRRIAAIVQRDGRFSLWVMRAGGAGAHKIAGRAGPLDW